MYFAEVRPFEQIFRQGEQPSQGEQQQPSGSQQQAEELAELQKQIISATWKLVRRESAAKPTVDFPADSELVKESQQSAIDLADAAAQRIRDAESRAHLKSAQSNMKQSLKKLESANQKPDVTALAPALAAEQAAYQDLLKLRAREFSVTRGNQQRGQNAGRSNRMQRQLDQLELKADENRYETQSRARAPEEGQSQQESRAILNKLRDLAHRQEDLNDRLRELQSALEKAQSPREREELERELKRLRAQQQEILRDTDEMIAQSQQSRSGQQSQDALQKMDESRDHAEQVSQALDKGLLSQAVTEGTRAGEKLNELRDDFRKQSANQFADDMTEMRRQARSIDERQQQLSQQLDGEQQSAGRSLRPAGEQSEAGEGMKQQQQDLHHLLEQMKQTVEAAEEPEPLLARQLYETAREANQKRLEDSLEIARRLADAGVRGEAARALRTADQGIGNLRRGVERAAESVLGNEIEALRRAQSEVNKLAEELNREIDQRTERNTNQSRDDQRTGTSSPSSQNTAENSNKSSPGKSLQGENNEAQGNSSSHAAQESPPQATSAGGTPSTESDNAQAAQAASQNQAGQRSLRGGNNAQPNSNQNTLEQLLVRIGNENTSGGWGARGGPITGRDFRDWSERLRDVEEMLDNAELRGEAARIRDRAAEARSDFKKHAADPDWAKLKVSIAEPLNELNRRIENELRRRESPDALVPIDRDPVPPEYTEQVRRYYERLGSGE
jgi:hypothetical protein